MVNGIRMCYPTSVIRKIFLVVIIILYNFQSVLLSIDFLHYYIHRILIYLKTNKGQLLITNFNRDRKWNIHHLVSLLFGLLRMNSSHLPKSQYRAQGDFSESLLIST